MHYPHSGEQRPKIMFTVNDKLGFFTTHKQRLVSAAVEFTSKCDLRCTYCTVSLPGDVGLDLDPATDQQIISQLKTLEVAEVTLNGRGETTSMPDWMERVRPFIRSFRVRLISNCARRFSDTEAELLANLDTLTVSIDSADHQIMRDIRRRVDLDIITGNILRVRIAAMRLRRKPPDLMLSSGIYDKNVFTLPNLARLAVAISAAEVGFWNLVQYAEIQGAVNVRSINEMSVDQQRQALDAIDETIAILDNGGIRYFFAGNFVETLRNSLQ